MKRTQFVGSKVTDETKSKLEAIAKKKDWTVSHLINRILEEYQDDDTKKPKQD